MIKTGIFEHLAALEPPIKPGEFKVDHVSLDVDGRLDVQISYVPIVPARYVEITFKRTEPEEAP